MDFTLRPWRPDDAASLARHADNPNIAEFLREGFLYDSCTYALLRTDPESSGSAAGA